LAGNRRSQNLCGDFGFADIDFALFFIQKIQNGFLVFSAVFRQLFFTVYDWSRRQYAVQIRLRMVPTRFGFISFNGNPWAFAIKEKRHRVRVSPLFIKLRRPILS
jgi:hypothetical protein